MTEEKKNSLSLPPKNSVDIMQSKRQLEELLRIASKCQPTQNRKNKDSTVECLFVNRQFLNGAIVDWKELRDKEKRQGELSVKDGENGESTIFEMFVEEWKDEQPSKVIYKWIRRPGMMANNLVDEEHLYRGGMLNRHKHGVGEYLITQRFSDHTSTIKAIRGIWTCDILENGVFTDELGQEHKIARNILCNKSNRKISNVQANKTIYLETMRMAQKRSIFVLSTHNIDSKESATSGISILHHAHLKAEHE